MTELQTHIYSYSSIELTVESTDEEEGGVSGEIEPLDLLLPKTARTSDFKDFFLFSLRALFDFFEGVEFTQPMVNFSVATIKIIRH